MKIDKSFIGIMILLVIVGGLSSILYCRQFRDSDQIKVSALPIQINEWKGEDLPVDERTYAILETRNLVTRRYTNPSEEDVYLYIVVSEINRKVAHPPEVCYTGDGVEIVEKDQVQFSVPGLKGPLSVNSFVSRKDRAESLVFYWFKAGDKFTTNYIIQQAKVVWNQIIGKKSTAALIRLSVAIDNGDKEKAQNTLQEFSKKVVPAILEYTP